MTAPLWQRIGIPRFQVRRVLAVAMLIGAGPCVSAARAQDPDNETELRYVDGLFRLGLPDYADLVMDRLGVGPGIKARRLQTSLARGEFAEVKAAIDAEPDPNSPDTWAMKLTLADGYFAWGRYDEARAIYDLFFERYGGGPPKAIQEFYLNSAYKYAQMLMLMNDDKGAARAYRLGLKGNPERDVKRQFQGDLADLLVKMAERADGGTRAGYLAEAEKLANDLLWLQDLWFGKGIVLKAHCMMLRGDIDGAMELVEDYKGPLLEIDKNLQDQSTPSDDLSRLSPMAEARYLLGVILLDEAKKQLAAGNRSKAEELLKGRENSLTGMRRHQIPGAIQHFLNVFIRYPNTKWAADAGARFEETRQILEKQLGHRVKIDVDPGQWRKVEDAQINNAKALFNQQQWAEASEQYLTIFSRFPQSGNTVGVLADTAMCYIELEDDLYADVIIHYIAERFGANPAQAVAAGNYVLSFASMYGERGRPARKEQVTEVFFNNFSAHPLTARMLMARGDKLLKADDIEGAMPYYTRVADEHARSPVSYQAMSRIATCYERLGDTTNAIAMLDAYTDRLIKESRLGHELIYGLYRKGTLYRQTGLSGLPAAVRCYNDIQQRLAEAPDLYQKNPEEAGKNQELLDAAMFYKAVCYAKAPPPKDKPEDTYQQLALKAFLELAASRPDSSRAPSALSQAGTLLTVLGRTEDAQKAFSQLKQKYPDSNEARNVDFLLGMSLLELDRRNEAVRVFKQMFASGGTYSDAQILKAGNELFNAGEYEIAIQAFDRLLAGASDKDRARVEPSLSGKGRALVRLGRFAEGADVLEDLFKRFPKTSFTVEASYERSKAYAELGALEADADKRFDRFNQAISAMKKVIKYDDSVSRRGAVTVEVGKILELKAKAESKHGSPEDATTMRDDAIATYQGMILFEDAGNPQLRPYIDEAYHRCLNLFKESERWQDLFDDAEQYLKTFPQGKHVLDARQWRSQANARLAAEGSASATAPASGEAEAAKTP
jgi:tetratricopeptide (TPR) repeat protein